MLLIVFLYFFSLDAATDYLLTNPAPPPSLRQASASTNPEPQVAPPAAGAGAIQLTPSSLAPGSALPVSRPSGSAPGGEKDELMRAIALSLEQPADPLEAEEDDLPEEEYEPLSTKVIDDFAANALTGCLSLLDSLPDTVYR